MINERLKKLRELMKENGVDAYLVPSSDPHNSEYVAPRWRSREWISGFTGSAGTALITQKKAFVWTDGRYFVQANEELNNSEFELQKMGVPRAITIAEWLKKNLSNESKIGFDGKLFSISYFENFKKKTQGKNFEFKINLDLTDLIWKDRPSFPMEEVFELGIKFSGNSRKEKFEELKTEIEKMNADYFLCSTLDDIAWYLNLRGNDIKYSPVFLSYLVVSKKKSFLFIKEEKLPQEIKEKLEKDNIEIKDYDQIKDFLNEIEQNNKILYARESTSIWLKNQINCKLEKSKNFLNHSKAIKNKTEIENLRRCHIKDGVAMVKFIYWLKNTVKEREVSEIEAAKKVNLFRAEQDEFIRPSFNPISAYKENAALMHYAPKENVQKMLKPEGMYLIDSGGQYFDGTTDITRTIALGELSDEEKKDFTLVLKGMINLSMAKFLEGSTGANLDSFARRPIWEEDLNYQCGTGHGVGFCLNVHEGPQGISPKSTGVAFKEGMIVTNEPGIYKEGKHGIRIENTLLTFTDSETIYGKFFKFETISFCPIDLDSININLLTRSEKQWLNTYHKEVYEYLNEFLTIDEKEWLSEFTRKI